MPITYTTTQFTVKQLIQWREKGKLGIPLHQRGYVWDIKHQKSLLDTIYRGLPISSLTLSTADISGVSMEEAKGKYYIEDGQQRVQTLLRFKQNKFSLRLSEDNEVSFDDLLENDRELILNYKIPILIYSGATEENRIEIFDRLQNGIILSYGERFHSMRFLSPTIKFTCETLLYENVNLHPSMCGVWGARHLNEGGDGTKRFRTMREAVCIMAGCLWGPEYYTEVYDSLREKLRLPLGEYQKKTAMCILNKIIDIYRGAIKSEAGLSDKKLTDSFWNPKNFTGYIIYSLWGGTEKSVEDRWIEFLTLYRTKPTLLKDVIINRTKNLTGEQKYFRGWEHVKNKKDWFIVNSKTKDTLDLDDEAS